jgi:hypothetical protein
MKKLLKYSNLLKYHVLKFWICLFLILLIDNTANIFYLLLTTLLTSICFWGLVVFNRMFEDWLEEGNKKEKDEERSNIR